MKTIPRKKPEKRQKALIIKGNSGIVIAGNKNCHITINAPHLPQPDKKKRKVSIDEDACWVIDSNDDFWSSWLERFDKCECHKYCLDKYHIIECGYTIQCRPSYGVDLYEQPGDNKHQVVKSSFMNFGAYTTKFLQELKKKTERRIMKALLDDDHWEEIEEENNSANARYVYDFFFILINKYMSDASTIEKSESMFNHYLIWPLLSLAVKTATLPTRNLFV
ncbi:hypothetical protein BD770DRAFT_147365 [Pilaira anomala]|nr:hypothetical protein BD770DRAFT_147365 [Pilaira anomala]